LLKKSIIFLFTALLSCSSDDRIDDPIPFEKFEDIVININLPSYTALKIDGGHVVIPDASINAGIRGIIIYRENSTTYRAFEQNCSFQPQDACATVDAFAIYMQDACCGSVFNYDGQPTGGLAWRPLGEYETSLSGSTLTITDNVINY
jgi:hypothetical protein